MLWFYKYLKGYLRITVIGEASERILNLAAANRISLWDSRIIKNGIETCIYISDFKALRKILRKSNLRVHIIKKSGLPIKLSKNNKRVGALVGVIYLFCFLQLMSGYIWAIDIVGNERVESDAIMTALRKINITEGIRGKKISPKLQREKLLLEVDGLAWAALNVEGSRLTVNVSEIKKTGKQEEKPTNLKASADGIIKKINVKAGNCLVKTGDTVKKGDVLVSGVIEGASGTSFVNSVGSITAVITEECSLSGTFKETKRTETGKVKTKKVLEAFTFKIPLYLGRETEKYNHSNELNGFKLFGKSLPIKIHKKEFRFISEEEIILNEEQLTERLEAGMEGELKKRKGKNKKIIEKSFTQTENGLKITALISSETDIAVSEEMLISAKN